MTSLKKQNGFTLVEVMVAITLLTFLMVGVYTIIENSTDTKDQILAEDREMMAVQGALGRFALDFSQIFSPAYFAYEHKKEDDRNKVPQGDSPKPSFTFTPSEQFSGVSYRGDPIPSIKSDRNSFEFFTASNRRKVQDVRHSRFAWVRYSIVTSSEEEKNKEAPLTLVRQFLANNPFDGELDWGVAKEYTLLSNIKKMQFENWNSATQKFESSVETLGNRKYSLKAVRLVLTWVDKNNSEFEVSRTFRSLWPNFDTKKDYEDRKKAEKEVAKDKPGEDDEDL